MLRAPTLVTAPFRPTFYRHRRRLSLSSVNGPLHPPLNHRTLPDYFASHILPLASDRLSLICRDERPRLYGGPKTLDADRSHLRWSFSELDRHVIALARGLIGMGVKQGDRVGVVMGNNRFVAVIRNTCALSPPSLQRVRDSAMGMRTDRRCSCDHQSCLPGERTGE